MSEFSVESEGVDVERIMEQIRSRIRANRGAEASDAQTRQQAGSRAEQLVDPAGARSALAARPRPERAEPAPPPSESFEFDQDTIYRSSRGAIGRVLYGVRRLLSPLLKFFFNIQPVAHALAAQSRINRQQAAFDDRVARLFDTSSARLEAREEIDKLNHQVMLDLVAEMTRLSVEMKNHRALVESVSARLDFFERQARAREAGARSRAGSQAAEQPGAEGRTEGAEPTRRRRRRGRRRSGRATTGGETAAEATETTAEASGASSTEAADSAPAAADAADAPEPTPQSPAGEPAATAPDVGAAATAGETAAAAPASTEMAQASKPATTAPE
ncbi:MAG: hypothetical protein F4Y57_10030, partial [Acidobacteria bacterium]|nr:hypothetical protein [Acidobacteriota bacterium]